MAEPVALEMRGLGLEGLMAPSPDFRFARIITIPKIKDDSAVEAAANKAAAGSGMVKAASWSDFVTKPAGNKAASASSIEPAAKVEGKAKQAAASSIEPVAKAEGKPKAKLLLRRAWELDAKPEPAVIAVGTERLGEDEIDAFPKSCCHRQQDRRPAGGHLEAVRDEGVRLGAGRAPRQWYEEVVSSPRGRNCLGLQGFAEDVYPAVCFVV
ncbi:hypothetical protein SEVIR_5G067500v4 [Setaria viridis]